MSANEILAANLWPWPDPLMKRARDGSIMFVNAAFLQLYGGRAQDWSGHKIEGWPAPAQQGAQRFETRAGEPGAEEIYDWVEMVMADGNAMAIARNVTALLPQTPPPAEEQNIQNQPEQAVQAHSAPPAEPAAQTQPAMQPPQAQPQPAQQPAQQPETAPALDATEAAPQPSSSQYSEQSDSFQEPLTAQTQTAAPALSSEPAQSQQTEHAPEPQAQLQAQPHMQSAAAEQPEQAETPAEEAPRMIERRALPIEDSSSVLGSNWRDQVIAKAIGANEDQSAEADASQADQNAASDAPEAEDEAAPQSGEGLTILLAEDNAINALLTRTLLEAEGAHVDVVEDGSLAVEAMKSKTYDLIFMDMRMPVMDGLEATRKIRAMGATLPIIALTANAFDDDRNACFDSGMNDFMTKPVSAEELSEMVINWTKPEAKKLAS